MKKLRTFLAENRSIWLIPLYAAFYLPCFFLLENAEGIKYHIIHMDIDDHIPFCEYFIVFYLIWFVYMIFTVVYCIFTDKQNFYRSFTFMAVGMTIFLIISYIYPNGLRLRPVSFERDNIFVDMVKQLYEIDTPTNVFPSIHVYNAIGGHFAIAFNKKLKNNKPVKALSLIICIGICASTLFLKQHSVFDVSGAVVLALIMYPIIFREEYRSFIVMMKSKKEKRRAQA
ncbi:MAG: phosphatase PAP2 family protein [Lachnospiraceae bacterium]|nr:phosphatase PAP2 family protein [Lachnospiraceae bacterium]